MRKESVKGKDGEEKLGKMQQNIGKKGNDAEYRRKVMNKYKKNG